MKLSRRRVLFTLLLVIVVVIKHTAASLSIGAIFDTNSRIGKEQEIAVEVAVRKFNASSRALVLNAKDLTSAETLQASSYAQELIQWGAQVIVSTGTWPQILSISDTGKGLNVPTISLTPSTFLVKPFLVQMSFEETALINCLADIVKSYNWKKVVVLYEDDQYGSLSGTTLLLARALQAFGAKLDYIAVFPSLNSVSDPKSMILAELDRMIRYMSRVYIILRSSENFTLSLFRNAAALGMLEKGNVWICGPDVATLVDSTLHSSFISTYMQGVIGIKQYVNESTPEYATFYLEFRQAFKNKYEKNGESFFDPGIYAARAYDALHTIALAAGKSEMNNNSIMDNLQSSNFSGLTGPVKSAENNNLDLDENRFSSFRVINIVGKSYKEIGFWLDGFGFYDVESQLNKHGPTLQKLNAVFWPGGSGIIPGGLRRLKVGVPANPIWDGFVKVENKIGKVNSVSGLCIDIFIAALRWLNSTMDYEFIPFTIGRKSIRNFSYNDLVNQVNLKIIDIAVGDITAASSRSQNVSFTEPFLTSGLAMVIPMKRDNVGWMLAKPFTPVLWISIFASLFYNIGAIWYLEKNDEQAMEDFDGPWYKQLGAASWIIGNTIFLSYGERVGNFYTKTVIMSWLLVVLIVSNSFTANLSSILVTEKLKPVVDKSIVGCDGASFVVTYLQKVLKYKPENIVQINGEEEYSSAFQNGTIKAAFLEWPYVRVFLSKYKNYAVYGDTQMLGGFSFALGKNDPMTDDFSKAILALAEDGTIKKLVSNWFSVSLSSFGTSVNKVERDSFGLDVFWSPMIFSLGTSLIMIVIFTVRKNMIAQQKKDMIAKQKKDQKTDDIFQEEKMILSRPQIEDEHDVHNAELLS